jgi:hypothetical protein
VRSFDATLLDAYGARAAAMGGPDSSKIVHSPREGNAHEPGFVVPVCTLDARSHRVTRIELHPMAWSATRRATTGFPVPAEGQRAKAILAKLGELCLPYGTAVTVKTGPDVGVIDL